MAILTEKSRNKLPKTTFGLPGQKKYPMPDKAHATNAKARATQQVNKGNLSPSSKEKIDAKANKILAKKQSDDHKKTGYLGKDSREGRIKNIKTDRGEFRIKDNRKG